MTDLAIKLSGIVKSGRRKTLGPIDLDIPLGHVVAVVGPNGSGKSTLLHLMMMTLQPDGGTLEWFGQRYERTLPIELKRKIAYVPEAPMYEENQATAEEAGGFRAHWYPEWDGTRFEELLNRFGVPRGIKLSKMSKGERRKFEIAAALACRPKLLLLDEPSSGLDPFAWREMIGGLQTLLAEEEITILICTHIVDEIKRLADYVVLMRDGRSYGMVEKDALQECFQEWWIRGGHEEVRQLGALELEQGPDLMKVLVNSSEAEGLAHELPIEVLRRRSIELEEALELWMKGHLPEELKWKRGTL
ncbi:multidrug ABC transporter ATP-binding protein [Paenibacillus yonginensis]|uniref:Multidrug ABC transporter ATP-binding protein n=1 Tax=Paenibacillus yonginensis TaxID=1462996 RepID=A0A1B1N600_9BACL|nr:ABC transporter ATP-binding protein [Paenibacillus yonginensis]ANS76844.1 multidrug ABC transporter ATP-binding protein [Paenibacillus yonginensis]